MSRRQRREDRNERRERQRRERERRDRERRDRTRQEAAAAAAPASDGQKNQRTPRTSRHSARHRAADQDAPHPMLEPSDRQSIIVAGAGTTAAAAITAPLDADAAEGRPLPAALGPLLAYVPIAVAILGLAVAAVATLALLGGDPLGAAETGGSVIQGGQAGGGPGPRQTRDPAAVYTPRPEEAVEIEGQLLFVKAGNVWSASGRGLTRITDTGRDGTPTWLPDGSRIVLVETRTAPALLQVNGGPRRYTLEYPVIVSVDAHGEHRTEIKDSLYSFGPRAHDRFFGWILEPDVSPDGTQLAVVSDFPRPLAADPTLSLLPVAGGDVTNLGLPEDDPFGHNDPDWSPGGTAIVYTFNERGADGNGRPHLELYSLADRTSRPLTEAGYSQAEWSPDGRTLVAVRSTASGRDIVILDPETGAETARLTRGGRSFAPTWSPSGRQIAYLHADADGIDLRILTLGGDERVRVMTDKAVTTGSGLDPDSPPAWFDAAALPAIAPR